MSKKNYLKILFQIFFLEIFKTAKVLGQNSCFQQAKLCPGKPSKMGQKWRQENWNFLWKKKSSKLWINHPEKNDLKNGKPNLGFKKKKFNPMGTKKLVDSQKMTWTTSKTTKKTYFGKPQKPKTGQKSCL